MAYKVIELDEASLIAEIAAYLLKKKRGRKKIFVSIINLQVMWENENIFTGIEEIMRALETLWEISQITDRSLVKNDKTGDGYWLTKETLMMALANSPKGVKYFLKRLKK